MKSIDQYGKVITELNTFVEGLDESIRCEAFKFLLANELGFPQAVGAVAMATSSQLSRSREIAPQEMIKRTGREKLTEKAVVLGYWLEMHAGKQSFSSGDLKEIFERAREKAPKNPSDIMASLEEAGRVMKADRVGGSQYYRLTGTALEEVEGWLASSDTK